MDRVCDAVRAVALVGPGGAGKTSLAEALLFAAGAISRQGAVAAGTTVGDASPEARARHASTEPNFTRFEFLGDQFALIDTPGSVGFAPSGAAAIAAADLALVVIDPDPARAALAEPSLRALEALGIPHAIFINRIDQARGDVRALLEALQPMSARPLLARQLPIRDGDHVTGFVDLALERAYHYRPGKPSEPIAIPADIASEEADERQHMLEALADHDDALLEALISDEVPALPVVLADLARELGDDQVVPVLFGSAANGFGIRRLLKLLRHETPHPRVAAARLGAEGTGAYAFRISHAGAMGRLAYARVFGGAVAEGADLLTDSGETVRTGALFTVQGAAVNRTAAAKPGEIVALGKADAVRGGTLLRAGGAPGAAPELPGMPPANAAIAITTRDRKDDVRLSTALTKLVEEDPALAWTQDEALHQTLLRGVNDDHLAVTIDRLKSRFGVAVDTARPAVAYREAIRTAVTQHGRHKKQSGGHGQFGDVTIEVTPRARGEGFEFASRITGGAVPKQWIPAVEAGVRDAMAKGPLGFPVVDVSVALTDGAFHSVDSSELAFRTAGRIAMADALAAAAPYLLEPVQRLRIVGPRDATSKIGAGVAGRRGQVTGIAPRDGWSGWDVIDALLPEAELQGLDAELRSASHGLATFDATFDHLAELAGKPAAEVLGRAKAA
jgi:elongation factor G